MEIKRIQASMGGNAKNRMHEYCLSITILDPVFSNNTLRYPSYLTLLLLLFDASNISHDLWWSRMKERMKKKKTHSTAHCIRSNECRPQHLRVLINRQSVSISFMMRARHKTLQIVHATWFDWHLCGMHMRRVK